MTSAARLRTITGEKIGAKSENRLWHHVNLIKHLVTELLPKNEVTRPLKPIVDRPNRYNKDTGKNWFTNRVVDEWNRLSSHVVSANTIDTFKKRLDKFMDGEDRW